MSKLTCPSCQKALTSKTPVPAGARIKCPGCAATFVVGQSPPPPPSKAPAATPVKSAAKSTPKPAAKPAGKTPARDADAIRPGRPKPAPRKPAYDDDDDLDEIDEVDELEEDDELDKVDDGDDEDDDRPRRRSKRDSDDRRSHKKKKGKSRQKSGFGLVLLIGGIAAGVLVLVGGGVAAVLMLRGGGQAAASRLAMIQEDPMMVMSYNVRQGRNGKTYQAFRAEAGNQAALAQFERQIPGLPELFDHLDDVLVSMREGDANLIGPKVVIALGFSRDVTDLMKKATRSAETKTKNGVVHTIENGQMHYVVLGNLVVMSNGDAESVVRFANDRSRKLPPNISAEIGRVSSNGFWLVAPIPANRAGPRPGRDAGGVPGMPFPMAGMPPAMNDLAKSFEKVRVASICGDDMTGTRPVRFTAAAVFDDAPSAALMQKSAKDAWTAMSPMLDQFQNPQAPLPPAFGKLMADVKGSLAFESSGNRATVSLRISDQTIRELNEAAKKMPNFGPFPGRP